MFLNIFLKQRDIQRFFFRFFFFHDPFLSSSCGRNFEDIVLNFLTNCRRRMIVVVFFLYAACGHLLTFFSWKRKLEKGPILRKMCSSLNIDHAFFWQPVFKVLPFLVHTEKSWLCSQFANLENTPCFAGSWHLAMALLIIILDPYMMRQCNANQPLYAFLFFIY